MGREGWQGLSVEAGRGRGTGVEGVRCGGRSMGQGVGMAAADWRQGSGERGWQGEGWQERG